VVIQQIELGPDVLEWYAGVVASVERVALCANLCLVHMGLFVGRERLSLGTAPASCCILTAGRPA
jgi:hypothetical protein